MTEPGRWLRKLQRELLRLLSRLRLRSVAVARGGLKIRVPIAYGLERKLIVPGEYWMAHCLELILRDRGGAVVDVGANVGLYLLMTRSVDSDRAYVGFEPNPLCHAYLTELIRINRFRGARVLPLALSDRAGFATLFADKAGDPMGSLISVAEEPAAEFSTTVMLARGEEVLEQLGVSRVSVIKIDVEGAESEVLAGFVSTLRAQRPIVYCEVWPSGSHGARPGSESRLERLWSVLGSLDYSVVGFTAEREAREIESKAGFDSGLLVEYLFAPRSEVQDLIGRFSAVPFALPAGAKS